MRFWRVIFIPSLGRLILLPWKNESAQGGPITVFVEVKTKSGDEFGEPWEMVNQRKLQQVKNMAIVYLTKNGLGEVACRIDVVGVWLKDGEVDKVEHWEDVRVE